MFQIFVLNKKMSRLNRESNEFYLFYLPVKEEIATCICCWETQADLPLMIEIF